MAKRSWTVVPLRRAARTTGFSGIGLGIVEADLAAFLVDLDQDAVDQADAAVGALAPLEPDEVLLVLPEQEPGALERERELAAAGSADRLPARIKVVRRLRPPRRTRPGPGPGRWER